MRTLPLTFNGWAIAWGWGRGESWLFPIQKLCEGCHILMQSDMLLVVLGWVVCFACWRLSNANKASARVACLRCWLGKMRTLLREVCHCLLWRIMALGRL